jgi:hypothetical protein
MSQAQELWHAISNESRTRQAIDDQQAARAVVNERIEMTLLTEFLNNKNYTAPHAVDLKAYHRGLQIDPSKPPEVPKSLPWFRENRRFLKVAMAGIKTAFVGKTGEGEQGTSGADVDTRFWKYCRGDIIIMFMWFHWGRGYNVPAHCSALLPSDCIMDVGAGVSG